MNERLTNWVLENCKGDTLRCKKNQVLELSCGTQSYTWVLLEGAMFTSVQAEDSDAEIANLIWRKGDIIHSLLDDIAITCNALTDLVLLRVSSKELNECVKQNPELSWALADYYHTLFRRTFANFCQSALVPSEERLRILQQDLAAIPELKGVKISNDVLALFLGMHRVSVSRLLNKN